MDRLIPSSLRKRLLEDVGDWTATFDGVAVAVFLADAEFIRHGLSSSVRIVTVRVTSTVRTIAGFRFNPARGDPTAPLDDSDDEEGDARL